MKDSWVMLQEDDVPLIQASNVQRLMAVEEQQFEILDIDQA